MASVYKRTYRDKKTGKLLKCKKYTIELADGRRIKGYTDRLATEQKAADIEKAIARGEQGMLDPYKEHRTRPLPAHITDYIADLKAKGRSLKYIENCEHRLNKLIEACGWKILGEITADSFCHWRETIATMKDGRPVIGPATQNQHLETARSFCTWAVKRKRMASNPLADVEKVDETADVRRARRALTEKEIAAFLAVVPEPHNRVYRFILATGLRRQELAELRWGDLHLDSPTAFLQLRAKVTKSRRADTLPLRADIAAESRQARGQAADSERVFDCIPTMADHKAYLKAAGIAWIDAESRRADFHALRHTYGTLLSKAGVPPREAMELMRHTDLRLTMKVYTDPRIFDLAGAVEKIYLPPAPQVQTKTATGTDGK